MSEHTLDNDRMRTRSGTVTGDPLAGLIYDLLRDGDISPDLLERRVREAEGVGSNTLVVFTNGWLGSYANDLSDQIQKLCEKEDA